MSATPKTRQKSCVPCASSKRKCDQVTPFCSRCVTRSISCTYKSDEIPHASSASDSPNNGIHYDIPMDYSIGTDLENRVSPQLSSSSSEFMGLAAAMDGTNEDLFTGYLPMMPDITQVDETFFTAYDAHILSPLYPKVGTMDRDRAKFCVAALKSYPAHLALTSKTAFINPRCYPALPHALQEACTVAALYITKNDRNEEMIWEVMGAKVNRLIHEYRPSMTVPEHLAAVQALIIFQIIRLFDGDITQRAVAEELEPVLRQWTEALLLRTGVKTLSALEVLSSSYSSWLFTESVTRTIIISLMLEGMYWIQKRGFCTLVDQVTEMSFTAQRALWEATNVQHWKKAKIERQGFHIQKMEFTQVMETAGVADIDDLGVLMLVTYKGVDGVNDWILKSGSTALIDV